MDKQTGLTIADEQTHIRQSIADILQTPVGSRVMRREYGSQLFELIDRPLNSVLLLQIAAASVMALQRWEPRVEVSRFQPSFDPATPSILTANIDVTLRQSKTRLTFDNVNLR